jgi:hypothetical protein
MGRQQMNPVELLWNGARELEPVLRPHGFEFVQTAAGPSSGGPFASGEYRREDRRLELHVRHSLGLVAYHVGLNRLDHEDLTRAMRARGGVSEPAEYPGFSDDPLDGFRHLAKDLLRLGQVFIRGTPDEFAALVDWVAQNPRATGLTALK